ncbi:IS3 family transposase [Kribbella sp. NPDC050124]|uniref:IS3 family transposase n=1 Tax=Kribbella sp. NPDC050124 TaxID=3364114 RepID=UPI003791F9F7
MSSFDEKVPDPEVPARARSRRYSASYKARILAEYEELDKAGKGALLRREGLYSSLISAWRDQRDKGAMAALATPAGRPQADPREKENARLRKENERLAAELDKAQRVIEVQGKALRAVGSARDRQADQRERAHAMIDDAITELEPLIGTRRACLATGRPQASHYRRHRKSPLPVRPPRPRKPQPRALTPAERAEVRAVLNSAEHVDKAPVAVYHELLDDGVYLASVSTMYRILREHDEVHERRRQAVHPARVKPELVATQPNVCWSWDITKLRGPAKWSYYYLYVIIDIYSRYVVGWLLAECESAALAEKLLADTITKQNAEPGQLTIHADNGSSMASKPVAFLLADLGVTKTHSRPHTSNDNPYSEAQFKTLKYRPDFPEQFGSITDARAFCQGFFTWYNTEHYHSGIGWHHPIDVHHGHADTIRTGRADVLTAAYQRTPERFVRKHPEPPTLPEAAWINKPTEGQQQENSVDSMNP